MAGGKSLTSVTADPTDSELVARMALGDREAFAGLFRRHRATVYRFSRQMLGSKEAAEDVTQDVFIALARNASRYDPAAGSLTTYLYGVTRNLILQRHKRSRAHLEVDIDSVDGEYAVALATATDPADELSRIQMADQLRLAILRCRCTTEKRSCCAS
jgi:RNA polymerase sigma-70 factor (ECF subfamily)